MNPSDSLETVTAGILVLPETAPAGLYSLLEVFSSVGSVWEELTGERVGKVRIKTEIVTGNEGLQFCDLGVPVKPNATFGNSPNYDFIIVPDLHLQYGANPNGQWAAATAWILSQYNAGAVVGSVCTGSLVLAETGLLDGQEATTHWGAVPLFEENYPQVQLCPKKILVSSGGDRRILTAGGASSWMELALYLIAHYCGRPEAIRISKVFLLGNLSEGQLPFAAMTRPKAHDDAVISKCQLWIAEHYEAPSPVEQVTAYSGLNPRTFKRRFRAATGCAPLEYIQTMRIEEGKYLLESSALPTEQVGEEVGYEDSASFRRLFKRLAGVTPSEYRRRYRNIGQCSQKPTT